MVLPKISPKSSHSNEKKKTEKDEEQFVNKVQKKIKRTR